MGNLSGVGSCQQKYVTQRLMSVTADRYRVACSDAKLARRWRACATRPRSRRRCRRRPHGCGGRPDTCRHARRNRNFGQRLTRRTKRFCGFLSQSGPAADPATTAATAAARAGRRLARTTVDHGGRTDTRKRVPSPRGRGRVASPHADEDPCGGQPCSELRCRDARAHCRAACRCTAGRSPASEVTGSCCVVPVRV